MLSLVALAVTVLFVASIAFTVGFFVGHHKASRFAVGELDKTLQWMRAQNEHPERPLVPH